MIKRFDVITDYSDWGDGYGRMEPAADGDFVYWCDAEELIKTISALLDAMTGPEKVIARENALALMERLRAANLLTTEPTSDPSSASS